MSDATPEASGSSGASPEPGGRRSGGGSEPAGQSSSGADKTYSQEQLDRILADVHRRNQAKYGDYDEVKSKLTELESATQTDLEKANTRAEQAAATAAKATERANALLIRSAVVAEAARAAAVDPDVVATLLIDEFTVKDDAIVGDIGKAVAKLLEQRPYLRANGAARTVGSADAGRHSAAGREAETPGQQMDELLRGAR